MYLKKIALTIINVSKYLYSISHLLSQQLRNLLNELSAHYYLRIFFFYTDFLTVYILLCFIFFSNQATVSEYRKCLGVAPTRNELS